MNTNDSHELQYLQNLIPSNIRYAKFLKNEFTQELSELPGFLDCVKNSSLKMALLKLSCKPEAVDSIDNLKNRYEALQEKVLNFKETLEGKIKQLDENIKMWETLQNKKDYTKADIKNLKRLDKVNIKSEAEHLLELYDEGVAIYDDEKILRGKSTSPSSPSSPELTD